MHRDNPYGNSNPNIAFQRDLDEAMEADDEYRTNPSIPRLCHLLAELAYKWEKIESQSRRMSRSTSTQSLDTKKKTSSYDRDRDRDKAQPKPISDTYCMGCNRPGHTREDCHHTNHPDFNRSGQWDGCRADRELKARGKTGEEIKLTRGYRSNGTAIPRETSGVSAAPSPYRCNDTDDGAGRRRDNDRRDRWSTSLETQVRPVSLVASLNCPATVEELMSTAPSIHAQLYHILPCIDTV
jgi:hypothetical protein